MREFLSLAFMIAALYFTITDDLASAAFFAAYGAYFKASSAAEWRKRK